MKKIFIITTVFIYLLFSQEIKDIKFKNLTQFSNKTALEITELEVGEDIDMAKIDKAVKKLFAYEYFDDITVENNSGVIVFDFKQKPLIGAVELKNYKENATKEEIETLLGIKKGEVLDEAKLKETKKRLIDILKLEEKMDSQVEYEIEDINDDSKKIIFIVNPGEKIIVRQLRFFGADKISKGLLEEQIENREKDILGWLWGRNDGEVNLFKLPRDSSRLKRFYYTKGFLDADISNPLLMVDFTNYDAKIDYYISEGESYIVDSINISSTKDVVEKNKINKEILLDKGDIFNIDKLDKMNNKIKLLHKNKGYAYTKIRYNLIKDKINHTVKVNIQIIPGEQVYINDVIIAGNHKTLDRVIRRSVYLAPRDLYSYTDLKDSRNELMRTGFFKKIDIKEIRVSDDLMDLLVTVEEDRTGSLTFGGGYGDSDGLLINTSASDRNLFGYGVSLSLLLERSKNREYYTVSFYEPRINDSLYSGRVSVSKQISQTNPDTNGTIEYMNKNIFSIGIGKKLTRKLKASLGYSYSDIDTTYKNSFSYIKSSIIPSITYNSTNRYYSPNSGIYFNSSVEYAGVGGDSKFIKNRNKLAWFYGLEDYIYYDVIFRYKSKYYQIWDRGNLVSSEKFKMGGVSTVRGYKSNTIYPKDDIDQNIYGGMKMFTNSAELSFSLIKAARMRLTFFYDIGMIGEDSLTQIKRSGRGVVLEWVSPVGPIDFVFAKAIDNEPDDRVSSFEFTLGQRF